MERLTFLALIRPSVASRRFVRRHLALLAWAATLCLLSTVAWHRVERTVDNAGLIRTAPAGRGWILLADAKQSDLAYGLIGVGWNPTWAGVTLAIGFPLGWMLAYMILGLMNVAPALLVPGERRKEQRLRGAVHYGSAFAQLILLAAWVAFLSPLADVLVARGWMWIPQSSRWLVVAVVIAAAAGLMWWFWLIRAALTLPAEMGRGVCIYYVMGFPWLLAATIMGWWFGMDRLLTILASVFRFNWSG